MAQHSGWAPCVIFVVVGGEASNRRIPVHAGDSFCLSEGRRGEGATQTSRGLRADLVIQQFVCADDHGRLSRLGRRTNHRPPRPAWGRGGGGGRGPLVYAPPGGAY